MFEITNYHYGSNTFDVKFGKNNRFISKNCGFSTKPILMADKELPKYIDTIQQPVNTLYENKNKFLPCFHYIDEKNEKEVFIPYCDIQKGMYQFLVLKCDSFVCETIENLKNVYNFNENLEIKKYYVFTVPSCSTPIYTNLISQHLFEIDFFIKNQMHRNDIPIDNFILISESNALFGVLRKYNDDLKLKISNEMLIYLIDVGSFSTDVSVLYKKGDNVQEFYTRGIKNVGGYFFTYKLLDLLVKKHVKNVNNFKEYKDFIGNITKIKKLFDDVEEAKKEVMIKLEEEIRWLTFSSRLVFFEDPVERKQNFIEFFKRKDDLFKNITFVAEKMQFNERVFYNDKKAPITALDIIEVYYDYIHDKLIKFLSEVKKDTSWASDQKCVIVSGGASKNCFVQYEIKNYFKGISNDVEIAFEKEIDAVNRGALTQLHSFVNEEKALRLDVKFFISFFDGTVYRSRNVIFPIMGKSDSFEISNREDYTKGWTEDIVKQDTTSDFKIFGPFPEAVQSQRFFFLLGFKKILFDPWTKKNTSFIPHTYFSLDKEICKKKKRFDFTFFKNTQKFKDMIPKFKPKKFYILLKEEKSGKLLVEIIYIDEKKDSNVEEKKDTNDEEKKDTNDEEKKGNDENNLEIFSCYGVVFGIPPTGDEQRKYFSKNFYSPKYYLNELANFTNEYELDFNFKEGIEAKDIKHFKKIASSVESKKVGFSLVKDEIKKEEENERKRKFGMISNTKNKNGEKNQKPKKRKIEEDNKMEVDDEEDEDEDEDESNGSNMNSQDSDKMDENPDFEEKNSEKKDKNPDSKLEKDSNKMDISPDFKTNNNRTFFNQNNPDFELILY